MRLLLIVAVTALLSPGNARAHAETSVLFIGNSFVFGWGSSVQFYRSETVTDLNNDGVGGVPALFKSFTEQAGLDFDVFLETRGGAGLDFHLDNKLGVIGRRGWDAVVMHSYSTLDRENPGDPTKLIATSSLMADFLRERNPDVNLYLMATWSRADQTYLPDGAWAGEPIEAMARDVRAAYDTAASSAQFDAVIPVGEAWTRAMKNGVADPNPYDGLAPGQVNLWAYDHYHASAHGAYLEALVIFGRVTGHDPRSLGENECSGYELGFSRPVVAALQQVAWEQLTSEMPLEAAPLELPSPVNPERCVR